MMEIIFLRTLPLRLDLLKRGILLVRALKDKEKLDDETRSLVDDLHAEACAVLDLARAKLIAALERAKVRLASRLADEADCKPVGGFSWLKKAADTAAAVKIRSMQQDTRVNSMASCRKERQFPPNISGTAGLRCCEVTAFYTTPPDLPAVSIVKIPSFRFSLLSRPQMPSKAASPQRTAPSFPSFSLTDGYASQTPSSGTRPQADADRDAAKAHGNRPESCQTEPEQNVFARAEKDGRECTQIRPFLQDGSPCPYSSICREMRKYL